MTVRVWLSHGAACTVLFLAVLINVQSVAATNNLRIAYQWKQMDYAWPNDEMRKLFPNYKRKENVPVGLEVAGDKLFVTVPRATKGVAASLNYVNLNDTSESPLLNPYPSWEAHLYGSGRLPEVGSTLRVRADRCSRLWVLDTGLGNLIPNTSDLEAPPSLVVYDLTTDQVLRKFVIPEDQRIPDSLFASIAVEDASCEDSFAYLADLESRGLVVYSWSRNVSWLIKHQFFNPDSQSGDFNVSGYAFQWFDGLLGLSLAPEADGYSTLYFHPLSSTMEFSVSTRLLRDQDRVSSPSSFHEFKLLGSREKNGQSTASFLDPTTGILFYGLPNTDAIGCWRSGTEYSLPNQGIVYTNNVTMIFPNDIKIDRQRNIWVLADRFHAFQYSLLDPEDYNFRIFTGSVEEAVAGTVCSTESNPATPPHP